MRKTSDAQLRAVKKYTEKLYTNFTIAIPKDLLNQFKDTCKKTNVSQRSTVIQMMQDFIKNN